MKTLVECPLIRPKGSRFAPRRSKECHWETDFCRMEVAYRHAERRSSIEFVGHDPEHAATGLTGILYRLAHFPRIYSAPISLLSPAKGSHHLT